jgi:hypothetical protein
MQEAYEVIDTIHAEVTPMEWRLVDCQEYLVDLEMSVAGPDQLQENFEDTRQRLEYQASFAKRSGPGVETDTPKATTKACSHIDSYLSGPTPEQGEGQGLRP